MPPSNACRRRPPRSTRLPGWLAARGGNKSFTARPLLPARSPPARLARSRCGQAGGTRPQLQPLLNFLMLHATCAGYDYLLRKLP